jgi:Do/DeqQ family serine protease
MLRRTFLALLMFICGAAAGLVLIGRMRGNDATAQTAPSPAPSITVPGPVGPAGTLADFSRIAERAVPAVVNVSARQVVRRDVADPFSSFFGQPVYRSRRGVANSLGSGVIISTDGYILTNNHVVTGDTQQVTIEQLDVSVTLADNREMEALVIGVDPATDLALLKVDARNLPTLPWGDSSKLKVAEWVLAIGNPYQLNQTVTLGIVSALNRTNLGVSSYEDFVQTDAAINPGNSGGALVNARGELIGINTVIFSQSGGYQGIGFAVSSNLARRIFSDLQQYKEVRRGSIGTVDFAQLTPELAARVESPGTRAGVIILRMSEGSAAYRNGIEPGDIIVGFNGTAITDASQLTRIIADSPIGSTATIAIVRGGRRSEVKVPVGKVTRN